MVWLTGYQYRKQFTISGSVGAGTGYQVLLKVGESAGATGVDFHLEGHAANFPNDIRFTNIDGITQYNYWIEKIEGVAPNRIAYVWIKVDESLDSDVNLYVYYGNPDAVSTSNGDATFEFFDDFEGTSLDTSKWIISSRSSIVVNNSILRITQGAVGLLNALPFNINDSYMVESLSRYTSNLEDKYSGALEVASSRFHAGVNGNSDALITCMLDYLAGCNLYTAWVGSGASASYDIANNKAVFTVTLNTWYILGNKATPNSAGVWKDRVEMLNYTVTWAKNMNYVALGQFNGKGTVNIKDTEYDWILIRKYADPEPAFSFAGSEETLSVSVSITAMYNVIRADKMAYSTCVVTNSTDLLQLVNTDIITQHYIARRISSDIHNIQSHLTGHSVLVILGYDSMGKWSTVMSIHRKALYDALSSIIAQRIWACLINSNFVVGNMYQFNRNLVLDTQAYRSIYHSVVFSIINQLIDYSSTIMFISRSQELSTNVITPVWWVDLQISGTILSSYYTQQFTQALVHTIYEFKSMSINIQAMLGNHYTHSINIGNNIVRMFLRKVSSYVVTHKLHEVMISSLFTSGTIYRISINAQHINVYKRILHSLIHNIIYRIPITHTQHSILTTRHLETLYDHVLISGFVKQHLLAVHTMTNRRVIATLPAVYKTQWIRTNIVSGKLESSYIVRMHNAKLFVSGVIHSRVELIQHNIYGRSIIRAGDILVVYSQPSVYCGHVLGGGLTHSRFINEVLKIPELRSALMRTDIVALCKYRTNMAVVPK